MDHPTTALADWLTYEERLDRDSRWALSEGSRHFEENSAVFQALRNIARRLNALEIPYAVVGGMALFQHGLRRFTEDVDILVTRPDLIRIHEKLEGLGYIPRSGIASTSATPSSGSRSSSLPRATIPATANPSRSPSPTRGR